MINITNFKQTKDGNLISSDSSKDDKVCLSLMNNKLKKYLDAQGLYEFEIEDFIIKGSKATWEIMADKIRVGG